MTPGEAVRIITISREYGAGGSDLARVLGERLGWRVIERELIEEVARRLEAPVEEVAGVDEHVGNLLERVSASFARGAPEVMFAPNQPDPDAVARLEWAVIRSAAETPPLIVVGHGAQCILERSGATRCTCGWWRRWR